MKMISKKARDKLEKIPCTLRCGGKFQYVSETKKGVIKMKCPKCEKKGLSNIITLIIKLKKQNRPKIRRVMNDGKL